MNLTKKTILRVLTTASLAGAFGLIGQPNSAQAAEWSARPVETIAQEIEQANGNYTVSYGDTLGLISKATNVDLETLTSMNSIDNANLIFPGQTIKFYENEETGEYDEVEINEETYAVEENYVDTPAVTEEAPAAAETVPAVTEEAPVVHDAVQPASYASSVSDSDATAKQWIAQRESGDNYYINNPTGKYIGKYQLDRSYLNGDHSPANQERVADEYVAGRYGSWSAAKDFWVTNGWY